MAAALLENLDLKNKIINLQKKNWKQKKIKNIIYILSCWTVHQLLSWLQGICLRCDNTSFSPATRPPVIMWPSLGHVMAEIFL